MLADDEIFSSSFRMSNSASHPSCTRFNAIIIVISDMLTEKQRRTMYLQEMELMAQTAKAKMEDAQSVDMTFLRASHIEHVRPMFRVCFFQFLSVAHYLSGSYCMVMHIQ